MNGTLNGSRFEFEFEYTFDILKKYAGCKVHKFVTIVFSSDESIEAVQDFDRWGEAFAGTLDTVKKAAETGNPFYVSLWQRHADGGCHRVCFRESVG